MAGLRGGMATDSIAAFVRWSQIEIWLRQLVHLEMSSAYGRQWHSHLSHNVQNRAALNARNAYMLSPDEDSLLAYGDVQDLFSLIEDNWDLFSAYLVPKVRWCGWADELRGIRNRIAHSRRPHCDDVLRLEQILRNIEPGAKVALRSYDDTFDDVGDVTSLAASWKKGDPPWTHIARHARRQYHTSFNLMFSSRSWAKRTPSLLGAPGILVHAKWTVREGYLKPCDVWPDILQQGFDPGLIVHYVQDLGESVALVFSGMDNPTDIANAIELSFQAVLGNIIRYDDDDDDREWDDGIENLDPRCHIGDAFAHSDRLSLFSVFNAEAT